MSLLLLKPINLINQPEVKNIFCIIIIDDPVDYRLAEYINTMKTTTGLKFLFIREGEGVY